MPNRLKNFKSRVERGEHALSWCKTEKPMLSDNVSSKSTVSAFTGYL